LKKMNENSWASAILARVYLRRRRQKTLQVSARGYLGVEKSKTIDMWVDF
jgi:hypothetical protein